MPITFENCWSSGSEFAVSIANGGVINGIKCSGPRVFITNTKGGGHIRTHAHTAEQARADHSEIAKGLRGSPELDGETREVSL